MIDRDLKRSLGQLMEGVQVVGAADGGVHRLYTSHWFSQVDFDQPIVLASVSPKHDTHGLITATGRFSVSLLAADQLSEGQYFSYPGHRFRYVADDYVDEWEGLPVVPRAIAWLRCEVLERVDIGRHGGGHDLFLARVTAVHEGRLKEPPLLYSSRLGWRAAGGPAREPGESVRDRLLARLGPDEAADD
jgi:3-hydroxy-9,10-secoandrosta-1,3,5(10)-triene-9,17-dione monooxygenase reductase component